MKPEDRAALDKVFSEYVGHSHTNDIERHCALHFFKAALAHRDAQPAVAVNEQMLEVIETVANNLGEFAGQMETQQKADQITAYASELFAAAESAKGAV